MSTSSENLLVRDNAALLVNNVAGVGGDEAVTILCKCKPLILNLVELLSSHDAPVVLQRFLGCINHLSRSVEVSCPPEAFLLTLSAILSCSVLSSPPVRFLCFEPTDDFLGHIDSHLKCFVDNV